MLMNSSSSWKTTAAFLVDFIGSLLVFTFLITFYSPYGTLTHIRYPGAWNIGEWSVQLGLTGIAILVVATAVYFWGMNTYFGGTLGKKLFGIAEKKISPKLRAVLFVLGGIIAALVLLGIGTIARTASFTGPALDKESQAWVDATVPQIVSTWNVRTMLDDSSPQLLQIMTKQEVQALFSEFSTILGPFKRYDGSVGGSAEVNNGSSPTAGYVATAEFTKGTAKINITAIMQDNKWEIYGFHVELSTSTPPH